MNWDAIGAIAELLGAIAVIISIIYLAAQVRHTRLQLQAQAEDNITSRAFEAYSPVYEGDNARVFRKGLESPSTLDPNEAFLFKLLMDRQRGAFATIVRRTHNGSISKDMSVRLLGGYKQLFLRTNGGQEWLKEARGSMSEFEISVLEGDA
ncbi:MAG: hypothetical protein ACR2PZ_27385 [Pseudomonadales bacterium]